MTATEKDRDILARTLRGEASDESGTPCLSWGCWSARC